MYAIVALLCFASVLAFKPNEEYGHGYITRAAALATGLNFCPTTIDNLVNYNLGVDVGREFVGDTPHCDDEKLVECTDRMVSLRDSAVASLQQGATKIGAERYGASLGALRSLGRALHTLQDFYAHSNYLNLFGNETVHPVVGRGVLDHNPSPTDVICESDHATYVGTVLSTGYFPFSIIHDICSDLIPQNKCRHGVAGPSPYDCPNGLNKDDPTRPGFYSVQHLAILASARFLTDTHAMLGGPAAQALFVGSCGMSIYYIIDTTESMGPEISGIISFIETQTNAAQSTPVGRYGLTLYGDPDPPTTTFYDTREEFLAALASVRVKPGSGGDCPELLFGAIISASRDAPIGSELRVFTDAGAKDGVLAGQAAASVLAKQQHVSFVLSGQCNNSGDPGSDQLIGDFAANTGSLIVMTSKSNTSIFNTLDLLSFNLQADNGVVFFSETPSVPNNNSVPLCTNQHLCNCSNITFTAADFATNYIFTSTFRQSTGVVGLPQLVAPNGALMPLSNNAFHGAILSRVSSLPSGTYTYYLCSNAPVTVTMTGDAQLPFALNDFAYGSLQGRPGDQVVRPKNTAPVKGNDENVAVRMILQNVSGMVVPASSLTNMSMWLYSVAGDRVFEAFPVFPHVTGDDNYVLLYNDNVTTKIPDEPFVVVVRGRYNDHPFQLALETPIVPQPVTVNLIPATGSVFDNVPEAILNVFINTLRFPMNYATLPLNRTSEIKVSIHNTDHIAHTFSLSAQAQAVSNQSTLQLMNISLPDNFTVGDGDTKTVSLFITPFPNVTHNSAFNLILAAHDIGNSMVGNYLEADVMFVGCQDCPQELSSCEVVNGSYTCRCYFGAHGDECDTTAFIIKHSAALAAGAIAGIVVGAVVFCCLLCLLIYCCVRMCRSPKPAPDMPAPPPGAAAPGSAARPYGVESMA